MLFDIPFDSGRKWLSMLHDIPYYNKNGGQMTRMPFMIAASNTEHA
jgi:hypothetical protein